ncbi:dipeptidase PepE [Aliiglaciecola sp. LCG003]|uniref:dipeptidase PepE n=1 Tax=Aliiglaciecola sp. LCG003 TaxID=3053655 RepID=UPI002573AF01|nr:dipeptidase PepE [Aliiglaciecola sp. LCG003]WJG08053.1 dipeptidase PepE [Aliiglaciecola sp. LCG003]
MKLLMLSSSKAGNEEYLSSAKRTLIPFLEGVNKLLFIPYAGVSLTWDDYISKVRQALPEFEIESIHQQTDPKQAIREASAILVGGGNTFNLLYQLQHRDLINEIRTAVISGSLYVGWSAGSNICGPSIRTTNDMPIIEPQSFNALNLVPFQLNPHYTDYQPPGHNGETRDQRIEEFCLLQPDTPVIGIREGSALLLEDSILSLKGDLSGVIFKHKTKHFIKANEDLSSYLIAHSI